MQTQETARIISKDQHGVVLSLDAGDACETCGLSMVCQPAGEHARTLSLRQHSGLAVGTQVRIKIDSRREFQVALWQFGVPMLSFLFGVLLGYALLPALWGSIELSASLAGLGMLVPAYLLSKWGIGRLSGLSLAHFIQLQPE